MITSLFSDVMNSATLDLERAMTGEDLVNSKDCLTASFKDRNFRNLFSNLLKRSSFHANTLENNS